MAGIIALARAYALVDRKASRREAYRFGTIIQYAFFIGTIQLIANAGLAIDLLSHHGDYDYRDFCRSSLVLIGYYLGCLVPLLGVRGTNGTIGHPRFAAAGTVTRSAAQLLFTASRLPFILFSGTLGVYCAVMILAAQATAGAVLSAMSVLAAALGCGLIFQRLFRILDLRLVDAEAALVVLLAAAVLANPVMRVSGRTVSLGGVPELTRSFGLGIAAEAILDAAVIGLLYLARRLEMGIQRWMSGWPFAKLFFRRVTPGFLALVGAAEWGLLSLPLEAPVKTVGVLVALGSVAYRSGAAASGIRKDAARLFRRAVPTSFLRPYLVLCAAVTAAPLLLAAVTAG